MENVIKTLEKLISIWQFTAIIAIILLVLLAIANWKMKDNLNLYLKETQDLIRTSNKYLSELVLLRKNHRETLKELNSLKDKINAEEKDC